MGVNVYNEILAVYNETGDLYSSLSVKGEKPMGNASWTTIERRNTYLAPSAKCRAAIDFTFIGLVILILQAAQINHRLFHDQQPGNAADNAYEGQQGEDLDGGRIEPVQVLAAIQHDLQ